MCFLRRNYAKTISRTVHAFSHTTILVPSTTIPHKRFYHIKSDSLACLNYFSRSNFIVRGKYQLLAYLRNSLSVSFKESTSHQSTNESLPHLYYSTPPPPPHTHTPYIPFKASFYYYPSFHVYASQMVPRSRFFN